MFELPYVIRCWPFARCVPSSVRLCQFGVHIANMQFHICTHLSLPLPSMTENHCLCSWLVGHQCQPAASPAPNARCSSWLCVYLAHAIESFSLCFALSKCLFMSSPSVSTWNSKTYVFLINFRCFRVKFGRKTNASWMQPHECIEEIRT